MKNSVEPSTEAIPSRDHACVKCGSVKPLEDYAAHMHGRNRKHCKSCQAAYQRELRASGYKPSGRNTALAGLPQEARARHTCITRMLNSAAGNARRAGRQMTLTVQDVEALWAAQDGLCALSGLTLGTEQNSQTIASLDRVDVNSGYTRDNVRLLAWAVNRARGTMADAEFVAVCRAVVRCNDYPERE